MSGSWKKTLVLALKLLLSAALLWWALRNVNWSGFAAVVAGISYWPAALGALACLLSTATMAYRWWRLVEVQGIRFSLWESVRLTWLGTFFNYVILGTTGGDLVKAYYLSKHTPSKTLCLMTVLVDRVLGLAGLTLLSVIMLTVVFGARWLGAGGQFHLVGQQEQNLKMAVWVAGAALAALVGAVLLAFSPFLRRVLGLNLLNRWLPLARQLDVAEHAFQCYRRNPLAIARAMGQTFIVHLLLVFGIALFGTSLGLSIPWYQYVVHVPLIYIIAAVPIVPGGVGLVESMYQAFFWGWAQPDGILALALLARLVPMLWSLPGVIVAMTGPRIPSADEIKAEMGPGADSPAADQT
jgi:glycosyltransferase 2 family protein